MEFEYRFIRDNECGRYSEQSDECFGGGEFEDFALEVSNKDIMDAMVELYSEASKTTEDKVKDICGALDVNGDYNWDELERDVDVLAGERKDVMEDLECYFRDRAYDEFIG